MSQPSRAAFVSYASEDAAAALRLAAGLRAAGIEVWLDSSELKGGDAWDHRIRTQLRECALFIPLISQRSSGRTEGYFRLEWHLADQRSHLMARSRPFIVPVCIDDTVEAEGDVPESFLAVQWARLAGGTPSAAFCTHVAALLRVTPAPAASLVATASSSR